MFPCKGVNIVSGWVDSGILLRSVLMFFFFLTTQHQTRLVMRAVPMIDNTALDSTATDTAGGNKSEQHSTLNGLTFSRELP